MKIDFKKFFEASPKVIDLAVAVSLAFVAGGISTAIARSGKVQVGKNWIQVERQAIVNQTDLEQYLTIIKIQDGLITRQEDQIRDFSYRYKAGEELLESAEFAADLIPDKQIEKLEERAIQSRHLLEEALSN